MNVVVVGDVIVFVVGVVVLAVVVVADVVGIVVVADVVGIVVVGIVVVEVDVMSVAVGEDAVFESIMVVEEVDSEDSVIETVVICIGEVIGNADVVGECVDAAEDTSVAEVRVVLSVGR